jgi:lysophospholipase L1-like esterase
MATLTEPALHRGWFGVSLLAIALAGCAMKKDEVPPVVPSNAAPSKATPSAEAPWVGTWASAPQLTEPGNMPPEPGLAGNTLRQNVFTTVAGRRARVLFSNAYGEAPVTFGAARLAVATGSSSIDPSTERALLFGGSASVSIAPGETRFSDPLDFPVPALSSVGITIHFGSTPTQVTGHPGSRTTSYLQSGDATSAPSLPAAATTDHWYFISGIDVEAQSPSAAVVTLGDSITDGRGSTTNGNDRWPDRLARRLQANASTASVAVLNQGIGGNAVVTGGLGPTATQRFERDVLEQRGVRWVIVLEGVNDIGGSTDAGVAARLIEAYQRFIELGHARGLRVYGVPILPFGGSNYDSPEHEAARQTVNEWVRASGRFDAVLHLDAAVADPEHPTRLREAYDTGDHLHLNPAGYEAMANAIDLALFEP